MFTLMYNCPRLSENNGHRFQNCSSCVGCITFSLAMGNAVKHFQSRGNVPDKDTEDRKRKRDTSSDLDSCSSLQSLLHTPKRFVLVSFMKEYACVVSANALLLEYTSAFAKRVITNKTSLLCFRLGDMIDNLPGFYTKTKQKKMDLCSKVTYDHICLMDY